MEDIETAHIAWYHTLELPQGEVTPGWFDTRRALRRIPFPESLEGKRCLDVGTADGFWAFEMERRGAAEVVAIDVDDPSRRDWPWTPAGRHKAAQGLPGRRDAFLAAHRSFGSSVDRRNVSIYELSRESVGSFDFVFVGSLLLHLRDPVLALVAVRNVLDGELLVGDAVSMRLTVMHPFSAVARLDAQAKSWWWIPNTRGLRRWVSAAGFTVVTWGGPYRVPFGAGYSGRGWGKSILGSPHAWVLARAAR